ncbi:MAG TPA: dTDP-glucose 4,6-dehydratase [Candidatus Aminicenantes bacterium]|nr:dTDP-glucose 4,6-dehydratase [Candidatus Aminicenantes bacterium]HRY64098.1 dTDP-glucose 4,6-dehydratase [Candidatus Aminicenantes bacterium]HRZ71011.1 dTDP-glucose 4,6-dehydratase [Candidatus Aminicenantes bacterium]
MSSERILEGKTLLVTGGAGFIGSRFIRHILAGRPEVRVVNLDKLTYAGNLENLRDIQDDPRYEFVLGDIRDRDLVRRLFGRVQAVVHFAAETHVDRSIHDAGEFVLTNVHGTYVLLDALRAFPAIETFVHVSTDEVYGSRPGRPARETDPLAPSSPYAASKAGGDHLARAYHVTFGLPIVVLRPSNTFGPGQFPEKLIPLFVTNVLEGRTLPVFGDGLNVRDWLYVDDHVRAVEAALLRGRLGGVYNVGGGCEMTNLEVARRVLAALGAPGGLLQFVPDRRGHDRRYAMDSSLIRSLDWEPRTKFAEGLERTVRWYEGHRDWWRKGRPRSL